MKSIINYFIKYHVAVNVIIIAFLLFGTLGLRSLKSSYFPLTESHIVQISAIYPGASPAEIEEGVILKIEDNLKGLRGAERVTSISRENSGSITVEVEEDLEFTCSYSLKQISNMAQFFKLTGDLYLNISNDMPFKLLYKLDEENYLRFFLAPKVLNS